MFPNSFKKSKSWTRDGPGKSNQCTAARGLEGGTVVHGPLLPAKSPLGAMQKCSGDMSHLFAMEAACSSVAACAIMA